MPGPALNNDLDQNAPASSDPPPKEGLMASLNRQIENAYEDSGALRPTPLENASPDDTPPVEPKADDKPPVEPKAADKPPVEPEAKPDEKPADEESDDGGLGGDLDLDNFDEEPPAPKPKEEEAPEAPEDVVAQGDKAVVRWGELKQAEKDLKAAQHEIAELKEAKAEPNEESGNIEELKKKIEEQESKLSVVNVESSDLYHEEVNVPLADLEAKARDLADGNGDDIIDALGIPDPRARSIAISELAEQMPSFDADNLFDYARQIDKVLQHRDYIRNNAGDAFKELQQRELAAQGAETTERRSAREAISEKVFAHLQSQIPAMSDDDGNLLPAFAKIRDDGKLVNLNDPNVKDSTVAFAAYAAQLMPQLLDSAKSTIKAKNAKIEELEKAAEALTGASGGLGRSRGASGSSNTPAEKTGSAFDRIGAEIEAGNVTFD